MERSQIALGVLRHYGQLRRLRRRLSVEEGQVQEVGLLVRDGLVRLHIQRSDGDVLVLLVFLFFLFCCPFISYLPYSASSSSSAQVLKFRAGLAR